MSWKPTVREAKENLQERWGHRFDCIALEHMANGHPLVHLVIKATCVDERFNQRQPRLDQSN